MATSTFDKNIYIDNAAADVLVRVLSEPALPRPDVSRFHSETTEEDMECFRRARLARLSKQSTKKQ